jgi:hypothetical protein
MNKNGQSETISSEKFTKIFQPLAIESTSLLPKPIFEVMVFLGFSLVKVRLSVL